MDPINDIISRPLFSIGGTQTTVGSLFLAILILTVTFVLARLTGKLVQSFSDRRQGHGSVTSEVYRYVSQVIVWVIGLEIVLQILGIELTALFAAGGFLAIGAGFAAKDIVENLLSGSILRAEKIIRRGDLIIANDQWLIVHRIGPRTVLASTFDGVEVVIPNSVLAQSTVQNLTRNDRLYRISLKVGVAYESDLALVRATLEATAEKLEWRSRAKNPFVWFSEFGDSSVIFAVYVWIDDAICTGERLSDLHEAIWWALKDANITIAFPQLDVNLDRGLVDTSSNS
jgi:potassium efflux system protein